MQFKTVTLNRSFLFSAFFLALIVLMVSVTIPPLVVAAFTSQPDELVVESALQSHLESHADHMDVFQARFNGRSLFYTPLPTPKPRLPRQAPIKREQPKTTPRDTIPLEKRIDPTYRGPSVVAILGEEVWFVNSMSNQPPTRIKIGEEKNGIEVVGTDPPWRVTVKYKGGEYDVSLFEVKEFLNDQIAADIPNPPGLIETTRDATETGGDATGESTTNGESDKNEKNRDGNDSTSSKSNAPDADNSDTPSPKTGNEGSHGRN